MMTIKRKPGRPRVSDGASADVHLTLPAVDYDALDRIARKRRESVQEIIRRELRRLIFDDRSGPAR